MQVKLQTLSERAQQVAKIAGELARSGSHNHTELHRAMVDYRNAAIAYMAHPSVGDYVRADARRYSGEAREAVERIADLIDGLCELDADTLETLDNEAA